MGENLAALVTYQAEKGCALPCRGRDQVCSSFFLAGKNGSTLGFGGPHHGIIQDLLEALDKDNVSLKPIPDYGLTSDPNRQS